MHIATPKDIPAMILLAIFGVVIERFYFDLLRLYLRNSGMFKSLDTNVSVKNKIAVSMGSIMIFLSTRAGRIAMKAFPLRTASHRVFKPQFTIAFVKNSAMRIRHILIGFL